MPRLNRLVCSIATATILILTAQLAVAATTTIVATKDSWVHRQEPNVSFSTNATIALKSPLSFPDAKEWFIEFQLPDEVITSAVLRLENFADDGANVLEVSEVTTPIDVNTVTWNTVPAYGPVLGAGPTSDGVMDISLDASGFSPGETIILRGRLQNNGWMNARSIESIGTTWPSLILTTEGPCVDLPSNAVSWWPMDGLLQNMIDVVSGYDGIRFNGVSSSPGVVHGAAVFDGFNDYIHVSPTSALNITGPMTVCLWYKADATLGQARTMLSKGGRTAGGSDIPSNVLIEINSSGDFVIGFEKSDGSNEFLPAVAAPTDGDWHFLAYVRTSSSHRALLDGVQIAFDTFSGSTGSTSAYPLTIGAVYDNGTRMQYFDGMIDEVMIFNNWVPTSIVNDIYAVGLAGVCKTFNDVTAAELGQHIDVRGVSWADYDQDGDPDAFLAGLPSKLMRNDGGTFTRVNTSPLNTTDAYHGAWADYDADGDLDIFVTGHGTPMLLRNDGSDTFVQSPDLTAAAYTSEAASWGNIDGDAFLDVMIASASGTLLFTNNGGALPLPSTYEATPSNSVSWSDVDDDGDMDLYLLINGANKYYRNIDGVMTEFGAGIEDASDSWGAAWGDFDANDAPDLYLVNDGGPNKLYRGNFGTFFDITAGSLADAGPGRGATWLDYDNDGDLDLYLVNNGTVNRLFRNGNNEVFIERTVGDLGFDGNNTGVAAADYDGDGDVDILMADENGFARLLRNNSDNNNHWLKVRTIGVASNPSGIGARVRLSNSGIGHTQRQSREMSGGSSHGQNDLMAEFGTGSFTTITTVWVYWPSGLVDHMDNVSVDQVLTFTETMPFTDITASPLGNTHVGQGVTAVDYDDDGDTDIFLPISGPPNALFQNDGGTFTDVADLADVEASVAGTFVDTDNDGDLDYYISNEGGNANQLFRNDGGVYTDIAIGAVAGSDDSQASAWADIDNDGDLDAFVVNYNGPNVLLRNEGMNVFTDISSNMPNGVGTEGAGVSWCDYDNDGDPDAYVSGGPSSMLIENQGDGTFVNVPGPTTLSNVAGAAWATTTTMATSTC